MTPLTEQQTLTYRTWLYEGTARLLPVGGTRPGWQVLQVHDGRTWQRIRELDPATAVQLMPHTPVPDDPRGTAGALRQAMAEWHARPASRDPALLAGLMAAVEAFTIPDPPPSGPQEALWEAALGSRFRTLPRAQQEQVSAVVGCDEYLNCPMAKCYGIAATVRWRGLDKHDADTLRQAGVQPRPYEAFIDWHDAADGPALAQLRAWLKAQQAASHRAQMAVRLRAINDVMDEASFQFWLETVLREEQEERHGTA